MKEPSTLSSDHELLLSRCRQKDVAAVQTLVSLYGENLYGFIRGALGGKTELVSSLLTGTFVRALYASENIPVDESFKVVLLRTALDGMKKKSDAPREPIAGLDKRFSVLSECLGRLFWDERILLLLRDQMDCSMDEMHAILSENDPTIRASLQQARLHFREQLQSLMDAKGPQTS